jgi:hypothetical protein
MSHASYIPCVSDAFAERPKQSARPRIQDSTTETETEIKIRCDSMMDGSLLEEKGPCDIVLTI